jgi:hypothetical protein
VHTEEEHNISVPTVVVAEEDGGGGGGGGGGGSADRQTQEPKQDLTPVSVCCWVEKSTLFVSQTCHVYIQIRYCMFYRFI